MTRRALSPPRWGLSSPALGCRPSIWAGALEDLRGGLGDVRVGCQLPGSLPRLMHSELERLVPGHRGGCVEGGRSDRSQLVFKSVHSLLWTLVTLISRISNLFLITEVPFFPLWVKTLLLLYSRSSPTHLPRLHLRVPFPVRALEHLPLCWSGVSTVDPLPPVQTWVTAYALLSHAYFHLSISLHPAEASFGQEPLVFLCTLRASYNIWHCLVTKQMSGECVTKLMSISPCIIPKFLNLCVVKHLELGVAGYGRTRRLCQRRTRCWDCLG